MPPHGDSSILKDWRVRACPGEQYGIFLRLELLSPYSYPLELRLRRASRLPANNLPNPQLKNV